MEFIFLYLKTGNIHGLGVGKIKIYKPLECLEKKVFNTQGFRVTDFWNAASKYAVISLQ